MNKLTPEQKTVGQQNFHEAVGVRDPGDPHRGVLQLRPGGRLLDHQGEAVGVHRRDFMKQVVGAGLVSGAGLGAFYFGYGSVEKPVRVGIIGTGDEGNVLIGACNPKYVQVVAIADIRPYNIHRAFYGDWASPTAQAARPGLMQVFGYDTKEQAESEVKVYDNDYHDLINDPAVEAVIIALPLHLHAKVAVEAMKAGKHVLTEKLMAQNVAQCKVMGQVARDQDLYLATGHQRHYSVLYDNAVHLLKWGILGEVLTRQKRQLATTATRR